MFVFFAESRDSCQRKQWHRNHPLYCAAFVTLLFEQQRNKNCLDRCRINGDMRKIAEGPFFWTWCISIHLSNFHGCVIAGTVHRWFLASGRPSFNGRRTAKRSSRCIDHRVDIWHSYSRASWRTGNTFHDVSPGYSESRWTLPHPRVCSGPCARIDVDSGWVLGKPSWPARSSYLLRLVAGQEMYDSLPGIPFFRCN